MMSSSKILFNYIDLINNLPDDCLIEVFRWLPVHQRVEIEQVCERWKIIGKTSWHDVKKLSFVRYRSDKIDSRTIRIIQKKPNSLKEILERCCEFLRELKIAIPCDLSVLSSVIPSCTNLNKLVIDGANIKCSTKHYNYNEKLPKNKFNLNFERLTKVESLSLKRLSLETNFLGRIFEINKSLNYLSLDNCNIEKEDLEVITQLNNLEALQVTFTKIDDDWLRRLIENCRGLKHLDIGCSKFISEKGALHLKNLEHLESLSIRGNPKITNKCLEQLYKLRELNCSGCKKISDSGIISLMKNSRNLIFLNLNETDITTRTIDEAYAKWQTMETDKNKFKIAAPSRVKWTWRTRGEPFLPLESQHTYLENISIFN